MPALELPPVKAWRSGLLGRNLYVRLDFRPGGFARSLGCISTSSLNVDQRAAHNPLAQLGVADAENRRIGNLVQFGKRALFQAGTPAASTHNSGK